MFGSSTPSTETEYSRGPLEYSVSVGLVVDGDPTVGVVYDPANEDLFQADVTSAGEIDDVSLISEAFRVLVGRGEAGVSWSLPLPRGGATEGIGSVAYRLGLLASGQGDAVTTNYGRNEWDVAAGVACCTAAGLQITDIFGEPLQFNQPEPWVRGLLVARPALHRRLNAHFKSFG